MIRTFSLTVAFVLVGCAHQPATLPAAPLPPETPPKPVVRTIVKQVCIPLRPWTQKDLDQVADKLGGEPKGSIWWTVEQDWLRMRDDDRACIKANK